MAFLDWISLEIPEEVLEKGRRTGDSPLLEFPFTVPAIRALMAQERLEFHPQVTFFIGENGAGKSTLMEAIADLRRLDKEGITKHFRLAASPFTELRPYLKQSRTAYPEEEYFLRAESFFKVSEVIEEHRKGDFRELVNKEYGRTPFDQQSHGQGFLTLMRYKFRSKGLYLFDEPESALSAQAQFTAMAFMKRLINRGSQFIIATHSPLLLAFPEAWIYRFTETGIERTTYEESEPYLLTRGFLKNPQRTLERILG